MQRRNESQIQPAYGESMQWWNESQIQPGCGCKHILDNNKIGIGVVCDIERI